MIILNKKVIRDKNAERERDQSLLIYNILAAHFIAFYLHESCGTHKEYNFSLLKKFFVVVTKCK